MAKKKIIRKDWVRIDYKLKELRRKDFFEVS